MSIDLEGPLTRRRFILITLCLLLSLRTSGSIWSLHRQIDCSVESYLNEDGRNSLPGKG